MNPVYTHLLLNHIPILGSLFGIVVLLAGIIRKNNTLTNTAMIVFVACALAAIPVFLTGEPSEDTVENLPGVNKDAIEEHEETAEVAFWIMEALGALALVTLVTAVKKRDGAYRVLTMIVLLASLAAGGAMAYTGKQGGEIRHTEINQGGPNTGGGEHETDED